MNCARVSDLVSAKMRTRYLSSVAHIQTLLPFIPVVPSSQCDRILIGLRTGFAFYDHHHLNRRMLIGVHGANTVVNNYYDGPADQLPENHIVNDDLRKSIVDSDLTMKDALDQFGYFKSGEGRYLISPYIQYLSVQELDGYDHCAGNPDIVVEIYDACFVSGDE